MNALLYGAPILQAAVARNLPADKDIHVCELPGISKPAEERRHLHTAGPVIVRAEKVATFGLVVKLFLQCVDYHVLQRVFAVIDARVRNQEFRLTLRVGGLDGNYAIGRYVLGEKLGPSLRSELRNGAHRNTHSVRINQARIRPLLGIGVKLLRRDLAC